jgi:hypothetical protein
MLILLNDAQYMSNLNSQKQFADEEAEINVLLSKTPFDEKYLPTFAAKVAAIRLGHYNDRNS